MFESTEGWLNGNKFEADSIVMFAISKQEVEMHLTFRLVTQIQELKKVGKKAKNCLALHFMGYDNDDREVYDIPEIKQYLRKLFTEVPEIFYFINIKSFTFAILCNAIFTDQSQVKIADDAVIEYAKSVDDKERVIVVSYYVEHHTELLMEE